MLVREREREREPEEKTNEIASLKTKGREPETIDKRRS